MNRVSIALVAISLVTSHLMAQRADVWDGDRNAFESRPVVARTIFSGRNLGLRQNLDGSVCFPPPNYQYCNYDDYNYYALDLYRLWAFYAIWNGMHESDPTQPSYTKQSPEPPPPPLPPATPVLREYNWPEQVNTAATFSIVTTSGTVYLATMVWVEGGNVHFNLVDGSVRQIPLSSVSRSLTETAKAPAASITTEPSMVEPGQPVTLKWSSTDATEAPARFASGN
jgi:hypothetical protein